MDVPSSLFSISCLEALEVYEAHRFASRRLAMLRGTPLGGVSLMFGGALCACVGAGRRLGELVLRRFPSARVDARGRISWRRVLLEKLVARGEVEAVLAALERASGGEEVPPP